MMNCNYWIYFILTSFFLLACEDSNVSEANKVVDTFYKTYEGDYKEIKNPDLLSKDLKKLINKAKIKEKAEAIKVKNSEFPTDKPKMIEGDIFISLYEGRDSYKIKEVIILKNEAHVSVEFHNEQYHTTWKDEVILIKEKSWKIDNVIFEKKNNPLKNTKEVLNKLLNS